MKRDADSLRASYEALKGLLGGVGYFRRGTLTRRLMPCGKPGCRCQDSPPRLHGPYHQWTRKVAGKTVTVRLTPEQAERMQQWIDAGRELDRLVSEMERLSLRATEKTLRELEEANEEAPVRRGRSSVKRSAARGRDG